MNFERHVWLALDGYHTYQAPKFCKPPTLSPINVEILAASTKGLKSTLLGLIYFIATLM